jgi:hypothetical protein
LGGVFGCLWDALAHHSFGWEKGVAFGLSLTKKPTAFTVGFFI